MLAAAEPEGRDITLFNWPSGSISRLPGQGGTISAVAAAALPDDASSSRAPPGTGTCTAGTPWLAKARRAVTRPLACRAGRHRGPAG